MIIDEHDKVWILWKLGGGLVFLIFILNFGIL